MQMSPANRFFRLVTVLATGLALVGCGGGGAGTTEDGVPAGSVETSKPSAEAWVADVCGAVGSWGNRLISNAEDFDAESDRLDFDDLQGFLDLFADYMDGEVASAERLVAEIEAAGVPDVENGQQAADAVHRGFSEVVQVWADFRDAFSGLDEDDLQAVGQALAEFGTTVAEAEERVDEVFGSTESPEVDTAFAVEPACQEIEELMASL